MLLFARQGDSLRGISQSASESDADQWLKAWMLYLWLAASVGVNGAIHVDCGAALLSQNGLPDSISNVADIRMLTMSMPECQVWSIAACTFSSNKLTVHFTVNVLPGSNWFCCQAPAQSWANIQTGGHRSLRARANTPTHTRTHTHIVTCVGLRPGSGGDYMPRPATYELGVRADFGWTSLDWVVITTRDVGDTMVVCATYLKYHRCRLSCLPFVRHFFFHCDTHACAKTQAPSWWRLASAGHKSSRLVLIFWQNLNGHCDNVWLACVDCCACFWFGSVASLWHACLGLDYLLCPATGELDFFLFGKTLSDVVAICTSWCQWYEEVMHGSIACRASSAIYLGLYFHCASHAACTHIPFKKFAIALAIGFSSESLLRYERLKQKKTCPSAWLGF